MSRKQRTLLPHGCMVSELAVIPKNWQSKQASTRKLWVIHYRFYDPNHPKPFQKQLRGMNEFSSLKERQNLTRVLIQNELDILNQGYNPFHGRIIPEITTNNEVDQNTPFIKALEYALGKVTCVHRTRLDIKSVLTGTTKAARFLKIASLEISRVSRKHIKLILEHCQKTNPRFSARRYNMYRAYLMKLFNELVELESTEHNPVREIRKQKQVKKIRRYITQEELLRILGHLEKISHRFALFVKLFYYSGARKTELFSLRVKDVDLQNQYFRVLVQKGKEYREVDRTINNHALPLWQETIGSAGPDLYIFSKNLIPGQKPIRPDQIERRWKKYVRLDPGSKTGKKSIGIDVDFNTIRHLALDTISDRLSLEAAATQAGHTSTEMVAKVYAINQKSRKHLQMKELDIKLG